MVISLVLKKLIFFKTKSGAVYLEILDNNDDLLKNHLKKASITLNGNVYEVKIVKQFFDKTIIGDSFFLTVDNKTGNLIVDVVDGKSLFLIGFEKNVIKTLKKEAVIVNDI